MPANLWLKQTLGNMTVFLVNILFLCLTFKISNCFLPSRISAVLDTDFTMEDIIRMALSDLKEERATEKTKFDHLDHINLKDRTPFLEDAGGVEEALSEIIDHCNQVDREQNGNPVWWFSDEKIVEGNGLLLSLRNRLMQTLSPEKPSYAAARETLGQIFHLLLMFYSNTNWVEMGHMEIYKNLGIPGRAMDPVTPPSLDTCAACGKELDGSCTNNILTSAFLTSGYFGKRKDDILPDDTSYHALLYGKCRHGGIMDHGRLSTTVSGGINKQSESPLFSPHYYLHKNASNLAIQHVRFYLFSKDVGLYSLLGPEKFSRIFLMVSESPLFFVDIQNSTIRQEVIQLLSIAQTNMLDSTSLSKACLQTENGIVVIIYNEESSVHSDPIPWQCNIKHTVNIQASSSNNTGLRHKRALSGLDIYHLIADTSGGTVYETDKSNIGAVVDIIKESVSTKPPVTVMKFKQLSSSSNEFEIPVDNLIQNLTVKLQGSLTSVPNMNLYHPSGAREDFSNASVATEQTLGVKLRVIKLYKPTPGKWKMKRTATVDIDVDVTASTDLEFFYQFMQPGPGGFGDYPLLGRPIAGENTTVQVSIPLVDKLRSVDKLLLLDRNGNVINNYSLHNVGGRRGKSLFKTYVTIPTKEFEIAVEGTDKSGNIFRRLDPKILSSLAIQLEVLPSSGTLYINQSITLPYRVKNVGGGTTSIQVSITDDKGFAQSPTSRSHSLSSHTSENGTFVLKAGPTKGVTTTVTISAKAAGAPNNKVQFNVRRITVEEKIVRVIDTKAPICNVTSTTGKCDFGADICQCSKHNWEMTADVGDDGDGLQDVFSSGAGNSSTFTKDSFHIGHTLAKGVIHTSLRADCCHQQAKITVLDLAGNIGLCDVVITPGFVAPDPKLCTTLSNTKPSKPSANVTTISCNITKLVDSCNGSVVGCDTQIWSFQAELGNEGFGRLQLVPVNAGRNANITRMNSTVNLSTDCCHSEVYINVVDIAGHTGQCHAAVSNPNSKSSSGGSTTASGNGSSNSVAIIAGGVTAGVVVIGAMAGLIYYLKLKKTSGKVHQATTPVK